MKKEVKLGVKGVHTFTICDATSKEAQKLQEILEVIRVERDDLIQRGLSTRSKLKVLWEKYRVFVEKLHKFKKKEIVVCNITTTIGRSVLAQRLGGDFTYTGAVNFTALGTDNSSPSVADATLGAEVYRKGLSSGTDSNNIAYLETFFTATEVTGTFEEYGNFIDGSASPDTGQLFNRFTSTVNKSNVETLNVQSVITFNDA